MGDKKYTYYAVQDGKIVSQRSRLTTPPSGWAATKDKAVVLPSLVVPTVVPIKHIEIAFTVQPMISKEKISPIAPCVAPAPMTPEAIAKNEMAEQALKEQREQLAIHPRDTPPDFKQRLREAREENTHLRQLLDNNVQTISEEKYFEMKNQLTGHQTRVTFLTEEVETLKNLLHDEQARQTKIKSFYYKYQEALDLYQNNAEAAARELRSLLEKVENLERQLPKVESKVEPEIAIVEPPSVEPSNLTKAISFPPSEKYSTYPHYVPTWKKPVKPKLPPTSLRQQLERKIGEWARRGNEKIKAIEAQKQSIEIKELKAD